MTKYWFKSNIFAQLSEIVEADSEKEVWNKIRNRTSFEIKQKALQVYPASIEIRKIKEKKEKNNMELKETVELMNSEDYKERFVAEYRQVKIRYEKLKNFCNKIEVETMLGKEVTKEIIGRHLYIVNTPINKNVKDNNKVINTKINNKLKVSKHKYGEYSHVLLTDKEHTHLLDLYGDSLDEHIKILDEYIETSGRKYKNHSLVIQKWVHDEWMKRNKDKPVKLDSKFYAQESNQSYADVQKEMERVRKEILRA